MSKTLLATALAVLLSTPLPSQGHPDFSGWWVLESSLPSASGVPQTLSVRQSLVSTNVRGEPITPSFKDITIEREVGGRRRSETYNIGVVGGVVAGRIDDGRTSGSRQHFAVRWDGNILVFESGSYTGEHPESGVWYERREAWSLGADNRLHVVITTRSAVEPTRTRTMVYRRA